MKLHAHSFLDSTDRIIVTFSLNDIKFSTTAVRKLDSTLVELLIHPNKHLFAVRTVPQTHRNAMQWAKKRGNISTPRAISGTAFMPTIYALLGWNADCRYRITGIKRGNGSDAVLIFNLEETEIFIPNDVIDEQQLPDAPTDVKPFTDNLKKNVRAYPPDWADTFLAATTTAMHRHRNLPDSMTRTPFPTKQLHTKIQTYR